MVTAAAAFLSGLAVATTQTTTARLSPVADTYVTTGDLGGNFGAASQVQVSQEPGHYKVAYLRFQVPALTNDAVLAAHLHLERSIPHLSADVAAHEVTDSAWNEKEMTYRTAPAVGKSLDLAHTTPDTSEIALDVTAAVREGADVTLALTSTSTDNSISFRSKESGEGAPVLELTLQPRSDSNSGTPSAEPVPSSSDPAATDPAPSGAAGPTTPPPDTGAETARAVRPALTNPQPAPGAAAVAPTSCVNSGDGIPSSGAYLGAAVGGTPTLAGVEGQAGPLALHRTYFSAGQVASAIGSVRADLTAGRLPWISFTLPYSWAQMAAGVGDAWAIDLANKLAQVGGPVWLAFHHEPEGDGVLADWVRMQQHLAPLIHARAKNVAYTVILTGWDALFGGSQYSLNSLWPGSQYVDILGIDMYNSYGSNRNGDPNIPMLDPMKFFGVLGPWARAHGVHWAIGEVGYTAAAAQVDPNWLATAFRELKATGGIAMSYFDSSRNSIADWTLSDPIRMNSFRSLLPESARLC